MNTQTQLTDLNNQVKSIESLLDSLHQKAEAEKIRFEKMGYEAYIYEESKISFEPHQIKITLKVSVDGKRENQFSSHNIKRSFSDVVFMELGDLFYDFAKISEEEYYSLKPSKKAKLMSEFFNHYYTEPFVQIIKLISMRFWNPTYHKSISIVSGYYRDGRERLYNYYMFTGKRVSHKN